MKINPQCLIQKLFSLGLTLILFQASSPNLYATTAGGSSPQLQWNNSGTLDGITGSGVNTSNNIGIGTSSPLGVLNIGNSSTQDVVLRVDDNLSPPPIAQIQGYTGTDTTTEQALGNAAGTQFYEAESFSISGSQILTSATFKTGTNTGSPTGTITCSIQTDNSGAPSGTLADASLTTTVTPTTSSINTCNFSNSASISTGTYWLVIRPTTTQSSNNYFTILTSSTSNPYAGGVYSLNTNGSWANQPSDLFFTINGYPAPTQIQGYTGADTTIEQGCGNVSGTQYFEAQSFPITGSQTITSASFKTGTFTGSPTGNISCSIQTDNSGAPSGKLANSNLIASITPTASSINTCVFTNPATLNTGTFWLVLQPTTTQSSNKYFTILMSSTSNPYSSGVYSLNTNGSWATQTADLYFTINGYLRGVDTTPLIIDNNGNVGIGSTMPTQTLDVNGYIRSSQGSSGKSACFKADKSIGYCSTTVDSSGNCTCN